VIASKSERLILLAYDLARERPNLFRKKGPGLGDRDTGDFMATLRQRALVEFSEDFSEKEICGDTALSVDFYFPDEGVVVEIALSLRNPKSEFERDLLKVVIAKELGASIHRLVLIAKPGGERRCTEPSARLFADWLLRQYNIEIVAHDLPDTEPHHLGSDTREPVERV